VVEAIETRNAHPLLLRVSHRANADILTLPLERAEPAETANPADRHHLRLSRQPGVLMTISCLVTMCSLSLLK
jgi:hypothetical protein